MRIDSLATRPDRAGRYTVRLSDDSVLRLYRQTIEDFGLYSGLELTESEVLKLRTAAGEMSAKMRAVRIVAASNVSRKDLEQRLIHKGENPAQAKVAVDWMEQLQLVDDRKTAEQIVARCASKGYGISRAKQALYEKRIPKEMWEEVLADYPNQSDAIISFLQARVNRSDDPKQLRKAIDALIRRGHTYAQIRRGVEALSIDTDNLPEE